MRCPIIVGNWKMNKSITEALDLIEALKQEVASLTEVDIVVCPPFVSLWPMKKALEGSNIQLGAQDMYWEGSGAYTGEVSPSMLKDVGCQYVIIGHSERRKYFGETNEIINKKLKAAHRYNLLPIVCVGERLAEREGGLTYQVVQDHISSGLNGLTSDQMLKTTIAYEPVWAIGTGKTATSQQAQEVHLFIRERLTDLYGSEISRRVRIQYGGSVKPENISDLMGQPDIDGALVGGASLNAQTFTRIVKYKK
jgi:triosephosphate isomerase